MGKGRPIGSPLQVAGFVTLQSYCFSGKFHPHPSASLGQALASPVKGEEYVGSALMVYLRKAPQKAAG